MASVKVRTRRRSPNANAPLSFTYTPNADPLAAQVASWDRQLKLAIDLKQMQALADGHTDQFIEFAKARIDDKDLTAEQREYWKGWLKDSERKVAEETLAAEIGSGSKKLEDLATYTRGRLTEVGTGSSEYPQLVKQLSDVKNAILARDFNSEVSQAQQRLVDTGDRQRYLEDLQTLSSRARSTEAATALDEQMSTLRVEIAKEQTTARSTQANKKLLQYYQGEIGRGAILDYLEDMAESAGSTAEANHYTTIGAQIDTRERTLQRQALSNAAASNTKTLESALYRFEEGYKSVDSGLVVALRTAATDRGGLERTYNTFEVEALDYEAALLEALPMATTVAARKAITTDLNALRNNIAERKKQVSGAVTDNILERSRDLIQAAADETDPDLASQFRHLAVTALSAGLKDELAALNGDQIERLRNEHETATRAQKAAISKEAKILAGGEDKGRNAVAAAFGAYQDHYRRAAGSFSAKLAAAKNDRDRKKLEADKQVTGPMADLNGFLEGLDSGDLTRLGLSPKSTESSSVLAGWGSDISQAEAEQQRIVTEADTRLKKLVAPRDENGKVTNYVPQDAGEHARDARLAQPSQSPQPWPLHDLPPVDSGMDSAPQPLATSASKGPGMLTVERSDDEPDDPYSAAERNAFAYLMLPTDFEFPSYELPDLPDLPDFAPTNDDYLDSISSAPIMLSPSLRGRTEWSLAEPVVPSPAAPQDAGERARDARLNGSPAAAGGSAFLTEY